MSVQPPAPSGTAAASCRALDAALPRTVDGNDLTATDPESPYTAAWGDVVLVCGAAAPTVPPTAQLLTVDGVDWFPQTLPQGGTRFSTVGRAATVSVTVPATHSPEADVLVDLGSAVSGSVPARQTASARASG